MERAWTDPALRYPSSLQKAPADVPKEVMFYAI